MLRNVLYATYSANARCDLCLVRVADFILTNRANTEAVACHGGPLSSEGTSFRNSSVNSSTADLIDDIPARLITPLRRISSGIVSGGAKSSRTVAVTAVTLLFVPGGLQTYPAKMVAGRKAWDVEVAINMLHGAHRC